MVWLRKKSAPAFTLYVYFFLWLLVVLFFFGCTKVKKKKRNNPCQGICYQMQSTVVLLYAPNMKALIQLSCIASVHRSVDVRKWKRGITGGGNCVCKSRERYVACVIDGMASTQSIASISLRPHMCCLYFLFGGMLGWHRAAVVNTFTEVFHPETCTHWEYFHETFIEILSLYLQDYF